jgi:hypothetical protein
MRRVEKAMAKERFLAGTLSKTCRFKKRTKSERQTREHTETQSEEE